MQKTKIWFLGALSVSLILTGCAKQSQEQARKELEKKTGVKTETGKKVEVRDLPKEFLYPNAVAKSRTSVKTGQTETITTTFETLHSMDKVKDFFDQKPDSRGWEESSRPAISGGLSYLFTKGDLRSTVILTEHANKIVITFSFNKPSK